MHFRHIWIPAAMLALGTGVLIQSCSQEDLIGGTTAITGRVVNPAGDPIDNVGIVAEYSAVSAGAAPAFPQTADGAVVLKAIYPNPATSGIVSIPLQVDRDTTLAVDVLVPVGGVLEHVDLVWSGRVTQDTVIVWNGFSAYNGLYTIRVTVPANSSTNTRLEMSALMNQPALSISALGIFNAQTIVGEYSITDIPVGEYYTGTQTNGTVRGRERIADTVLLLFTDTNGIYQSRESQILISPGDVVTLTTTLNP